MSAPLWTKAEIGAAKVLASGHVPIPLEVIEKAENTVSRLIEALEASTEGLEKHNGFDCDGIEADGLAIANRALLSELGR